MSTPMTFPVVPTIFDEAFESQPSLQVGRSKPNLPILPGRRTPSQTNPVMKSHWVIRHFAKLESALLVSND
jgi:hypothetical protein